MSRARPGVTASLLIVTVLLGVLGGAFAGGISGFLLGRAQSGPALSPISGAAKNTTTPQAGTQPRATPGDVQVRLSEDNAIIEASRKAGPSVVTVVNTVADRRTRFGQQLAQTSLGSGVIVDPRGFVLTNEHVIRGTRDLSVVLSTGEQLPARLVGTDIPFTDLAVIKFDPTGSLQVAEWGDSDAVQPGQRSIAIGSSLGDLRNSITQGIVSGINRSIPAASFEATNTETIQDFIQTDAAINSGNSGGPLINSLGQVIGINTFVRRNAQAGRTIAAVDGVGFAIPSNTAAQVAQQIIDRGKVSRPDLGLREYVTLNRQYATFYGLPTQQGAFVVRIAPNSPASAAPLQEGDIITKIGNFDLTETDSLSRVLMRFQPSDRVQLTIFRGNRQQVVNLTLAER